MKRKVLLLLPIIFAAMSCAGQNHLDYSVIDYGERGGVIIGEGSTQGDIGGFSVVYDWNSSFDKNGKPIATPCFQTRNSGIGTLNKGFKDVAFPKTFVAGDYFLFYYEGALTYEETSPCRVNLDGTVGKYYYERASVDECTKDTTQKWTDIADYGLWQTLDNKMNVIIDKQGHYVPLSEYDSDVIYLTSAAGVFLPAACLTPDCHELKFVIGAMFAYAPDISL